MRCADVMTKDPVFVRTADAVAVANRVMRTRGVGFLPVCDAKGAVVGFVTEQHLTRVVLEDDVGPSALVESVMGRDPSLCSPDDDVSIAEQAITAHPGRCAVCVGPTGEPIGVIGVSDLARARNAPH
jgi:predicted transcriptional regulator